MIRFINCMKRKPECSTEQFREYWNAPQFTALIERIAAQTGASLYAKNATLMVAANDLVRELRGSSEPFDGVLEYWWDNTSHLNELTETARPSSGFSTEPFQARPASRSKGST